MYKKNEVVISNSEWLVLQAIWDNKTCYMGDIVSALSYTPWSRTTIQTMVGRLIAKKVIETNHTGYAFLYYPLISEKEAIEMYTKAFIERVFKGSSFDCISAVASGDYLTPEEKKELKKVF